LEIMAPQFRHERFSETLGQLVGILAETLNLPFVRGGSTTFRRQDLLRGLEPDRCFYLQHAAEIVGQLDLDLTRDPPPDLAIEVDIWSGSINRLEIYAALGVPEVWRFDGEQFEVFCLSDQGKFEPWNQSPAFPTLPVAGVASLLQEVVLLDDLSQLRRLRAWVNQYAATPGH
jgi:Uma2 family endonuclease